MCPGPPRRGPPRDATGNGNAAAFPAFSFRRVAIGPGFGASPSALAPGVRAETLPGSAREFYLEVRLGRAAPRGDRAAGGTGAEVVLQAVGVSRHHATLTLS